MQAWQRTSLPLFLSLQKLQPVTQARPIIVEAAQSGVIPCRSAGGDKLVRLIEADESACMMILNPEMRELCVFTIQLYFLSELNFDSSSCL